jgi:DNA-directed RNA polymerase beta' subunit
MFVFVNFVNFNQYVASKSDFSDASTERLISGKNIDYYTMREVVIKYIQNSKVKGISGIEKIYPRDDGCVDTKGANLREILLLDNIDPYKTICDDVHQIYTELGVEAARSFLISEITKIVGFDGAYINPRHNQLLVESMTYAGTLTCVRRDGISRDDGPIGKITFERPTVNCGTAACYGEYDTTLGVSSGIMLGKLVNAGTGRVKVVSSEVYVE